MLTQKLSEQDADKLTQPWEDGEGAGGGGALKLRLCGEEPLIFNEN